MQVKTFDSSEQVVEALAKELLCYSQCEHPVHIALSGGSTPKQLFRFLAGSEYATSISWQNLHFWWGDERCVAPDSSESNYGEAFDLLFRHVAIPESNLHRIRGEADPVTERDRIRKEMKRFLNAKLGRPQFDWILLGVGEDGHTASLFPGQTDYVTDEGAVVAMHPETGQQRISLAAPIIRVAKRITYLVLGEGKATVVRNILHKEGEYLEYPAANIETTEGETEWFLDQGSANKLDRSPLACE